MRLQASAMYVFDAAGRITGFNEPMGKVVDCPVVFLGRCAAGNVVGIRADVPDAIAEELAVLLADEPAHADEAEPRHADELRRRVRAFARWTIEFSGPAFRFGDPRPPIGDVKLLGPEWADTIVAAFPNLADSVRSRAPIVGVVEHGEVLSICYAATGPGDAVEAGVDTIASARGRGLAPRVVASWSALVRESGRVPLYSTSWTNTASRAVARKLALIQYGTDWHLR